MRRTFLMAGTFLLGQFAFANTHLTINKAPTPRVDSVQKAPENWFNLDPTDNKVPGVSTEKAYEYLKNRPSKTVVVAVIDSGIDILHEDLKDKIWTNEKEIAGNGLDDDKNGYVDDVHGWNFIGGKDGKHVQYDTQELTRLYAELRSKFEGEQAETFRKKEKENYARYQKIKAEFEKEVKETQAQYSNLQEYYSTYKLAAGFIAKFLNKEDFSLTEVKNITSSDLRVTEARRLILLMADNGLTKEQFTEGEDYFMTKLKYNLNPEYNPRTIVGDDYTNPNDKNYGNNDVTGPSAEHGTHVAGIIGANRNNDLGIKGVADNVKIMVIRAVPNGDERDKDVANAIYYAVNNGARVINMSFGKEYSPQESVVDAAVKYAADKGVLLVHGSGNDAENIDDQHNFPNKQIGPNQVVKSWIEVGASAYGDALHFVGDFSNYGKKSVDIFAPGVDIYSAAPNQKYKSESGTSMASPVTAGVGALLFSYFPNLTAEQIQDIILKSSVKHKGLKVNKPGLSDKTGTISFDSLSVTGGIVNAFEAVKLADTISRKQ